MTYLLIYVLIGLLAIFNQVVLDTIDDKSRDLTGEEIFGLLALAPIAVVMQFGYITGQLINHFRAKV